MTEKDLDQRHVPGKLSAGSPSCPLIWSLLSLQYQLKAFNDTKYEIHVQIDFIIKFYTGM